MNKEQLQNIFKQSFSYETWQSVLINLFGVTALRKEPTTLDSDTNEKVLGYQLGKLDTTDHYTIGLFTFEIKGNTNIKLNRVGLRSLVHSYIKYGYDAAIVVYYDKTHWRLSFVCDLKNEKTAPKRFTYVFGNPQETYRTAAVQLSTMDSKEPSFKSIKEAFSVEKLSKDFFNGYKERYKNFCNYIGGTEKWQRDYVKKMMGRLVFLQFLQKKGWMGVPANRENWTGGDLQYMQNLIQRYDGNNRLLSDILEPLFFETLNTKRNDDIADSILGNNIKIPYLNGGLFDKDSIDKENIDFPYEYFADLMDFFSQYNFTIDENDPYDSEIGIDPEMLGHIFENLLEDNKNKGAFYTPKEIVQYMCRESLVEYLQTKLGEHKEIKDFIYTHNIGDRLDKKNFIVSNAKLIAKLLDDVKVCDPAIGSGAFPMGILNEIFHAKMALDLTLDRAEVKKNIIQNSIFGVDIEQGAVDIARLRFWLALVVDDDKPQPLPNLDYKIMCGNSLLNRFDLNMSIDDVFNEYNEGKDDSEQMSLDKYRKLVYKFTNTSDHTKKEEFREIIENIKATFELELSDYEKNKATRIKRKISDYESPSLFGERSKEELDRIKELKAQLKSIEKKKENFDYNKIYDNAFEWRFEFPALLDVNGDYTGFDIVIANPPYGAKLSSVEKSTYKEKYKDVHMRSPETYCYFISLAFYLAKNENAVVTYIVPNNMLFQNENEKTRGLLMFKHKLVRAINLGDNTFENADVPTCIFVSKTNTDLNYSITYSDYRKYNISKINWNSDLELISIDLIETIPSSVIGMSNSDINILNTIKENSVTIDSIAEEMASGISSGGDKIFRVNDEIIDKYGIESNILRPILAGSDMSEYQINYTGDKIIYTTRATNISDYPATMEYLHLYIDKLEKRSETKSGILPWFALNRNRYAKLFEEPKIIMRQTSDCIRCEYDTNGYYTLDSILIFKKKKGDEKFDYKYIVTVLNSTLTDYLYKQLTQEEGRTFAQVKPINVRKLYIPKATKEEQQILSTLYDYLSFLCNFEMFKMDEVISNLFIEEFFKKIIDGCVYELIFKDHMKNRQINIIDSLKEYLKKIGNLNNIGKKETVLYVFNKLYKTDNPVRTRLNLFVSRSPEFLKPIIQH